MFKFRNKDFCEIAANITEIAYLRLYPQPYLLKRFDEYRLLLYETLMMRSSRKTRPLLKWPYSTPSFV